MKKLLKWLAIVVVALAVVVAGLALTAQLLAERKRERIVRIDVKPVAAATDAAALERGKYLFASRGCGDCHGSNGAGRPFIDSPGMTVRTPNISPGGAVAKYSDADWVRAIRHGVKPDGRPLFIMPSEDYNRWTDADVAALVGYMRSMPAVPGGGAEFRLPFSIKLVYALGVLKDSAEKIDHSLPPAQPVAEGVTADHGKYVANLCLGCHGPNLSGGKIPGSPPNWPPASNLTTGSGTVLATYDTLDKFKAMFRSGKRPDGSAVAVMPFDTLKEMSEVDVAALYTYLKSLPARPVGGR